MPIDVKLLQCDYLSATGRKFLRGPRGVGFLYASDRALARGDHPLFIDMRGARWVDRKRYEVAPTAMRYEDWEFPYALVLGLGAAARYALEVGVDVAGNRAFGLARHVREKLREIRGVRVLDGGRSQCAIVTASIGNRDASDLVKELSRLGINTAASLRWYGLLDFTEKDVESAIRISPHYYNTQEEIDVVTDVIAAWLH
jgi:selenocysteine lyase/cysteine desulfurase